MKKKEEEKTTKRQIKNRNQNSYCQMQKDQKDRM